MAQALLATADSSFILGPIAKLLGLIMNGIFSLGVHNVGICIIIFTIIIYMLQLPLTFKQQKFSRMTAIMNPEIQAVQRKYKNRNDQASMQKMQNETKEIYDKYGMSMSGGCLPMLIQFPILMGFYRVIYNIPAYVPAIKNLYNANGLLDVLKTALESGTIKASEFTGLGTAVRTSLDDVTKNKIIDVLWKFSDSSWESLKELGASIADFPAIVDSTYAAIRPYTIFCGISIAESPLNLFKASWGAHAYGWCLVAILIPLLSGATQMINMKMMPMQTQQGNSEQSAMNNSMKSMNTMMPIISVFFCFTLPFGLGLYWIVGAIVRAVQMFFINRHYDKMDINVIIEKNREKAKKKKEKRGVVVNENLKQKATTNTRNIKSANKVSSEQANKKRTGVPKEGSLASKANMVQRFNEKNK